MRQISIILFFSPIITALLFLLSTQLVDFQTVSEEGMVANIGKPFTIIKTRPFNWYTTSREDRTPAFAYELVRETSLIQMLENASQDKHSHTSIYPINILLNILVFFGLGMITSLMILAEFSKDDQETSLAKGTSHVRRATNRFS